MKSLIFISAALLAILPCQAQEAWSLERCITHALDHNLTIKQQEDNVKQQEISLNTSRNQRLPSLNGSAGESFSFGRALTIDNTYANRNTQSTNFNLSTDVPIFTGGQIYYDIKVKSLNLQAALADLDKARESVALNVISAYLEAVYQKDLVTVAEQQSELSKAQTKRMQILFDNKKIAEADLAQIRTAQANDELSLTQQQNQYTLALLTLSQLLELSTPEGVDVMRPEIGDVASIVLPLPDAIYADAVGIKPQIKAEELRLMSAEKSILLAKSGYYPSIRFGAGLGSSYYKSSGIIGPQFGRQMKDNFNQYLSLNLSIPIFNRFQTRNNVRSARLNLHNQQLQMEQTKKSLYKEIQQAYYNALASQKQCQSSATALESSRTSFKLMEAKYEHGKANATEYQDAKTQLFKAESTALQAQYTFLFRQKILNFYRSIEFWK